jgi:uncharacterized protein YecE (DUF72 family)
MLPGNENTIYSGTSGLVLPVRKSLYPGEFQGKSRLAYYSSLFNSVEINSSFYKMPMTSTVSKWAATVPDNFQFSFKLSKNITHARGLDFKEQDIEEFMKVVANIGWKSGCLLVQFPPALKIENIRELHKLLISIQHADPLLAWKPAVEFRNSSWYQQDTYQLLDEHNAGIVVHDLPGSATPLMNRTGGFAYLRFHGPDGRYGGNYSDDFLVKYAEYIKGLTATGKSVYFYFNNTLGNAFRNLATLNRLLEI